MAEQSKLRVAGENAKQVVRAIGQDESLCLRCTNSESTCQACVDICPGKAVRIPKSTEHAGGFKVTIGKGFCVDCGLCAAVCPTDSIIVMEPTARYLRHLLKRAQAMAGGTAHTLYLTCIETGIAKESPSVVEVPCLGAIAPETWASLMLDFPNLAVYLPGDLCPRCKAKAAEMRIVDSVMEAIEVVGREMPLVETRRELEWTDSAGKVRKSGDGDEPFGEMLSGFGDLAHDLKNDLTHAEENLTEEERCNSDQRKTRVRLRKEIRVAEGETTPGLKGADDLTGTLTASRATILDAVMRFPQIASRVMLKGVRIDAEKAGEAAMNAVVAGCPLGAAHMQDGACVVDPLVCVDCGLCRELCPEGAVESVETCVADLLRDPVAAE